MNEGRMSAGNIPFLELGDDYTDALFVILNSTPQIIFFYIIFIHVLYIQFIYRNV